MKTKDLYCGRTDLFTRLWCTVDGTGRVARTAIKDGIQYVLLLDLELCWDYLDHLRVKTPKCFSSNEKVKLSWKVAMYARNTKVWLRDVLISSI